MTKEIKVLLADDEEDIKTTLRLYLQRQGYIIDTAYDGLDTLDKAKVFNPDVILLDIMMPLVDGIEVCKKIKADPETKDVKIIMVSSASTKEMYIKSKEAGAEDFVVKPFEFSAVELAIKKLFP